LLPLPAFTPSYFAIIDIHIDYCHYSFAFHSPLFIDILIIFIIDIDIATIAIFIIISCHIAFIIAIAIDIID